MSSQVVEKIMMEIVNTGNEVLRVRYEFKFNHICIIYIIEEMHQYATTNTV